VSQRLAGGSPVVRNSLGPCECGHQPADNRAFRISVSRDRHGRPKRLAVVAEMARKGPEEKGTVSAHVMFQPVPSSRPATRGSASSGSRLAASMPVLVAPAGVDDSTASNKESDLSSSRRLAQAAATAMAIAPATPSGWACVTTAERVASTITRAHDPVEATRGPRCSHECYATAAAAAPATSFSKTSSPSRASTTTVSPSPMPPSRSRIASGFSTRRWRARLSGRAP
jgi:hypothetical protein